MSERPEGKAAARHNDLSCTPSARCPSDIFSASVAAERAYSSYVSEQRSSQRSHSGRAAIFEMRSSTTTSDGPSSLILAEPLTAIAHQVHGAIGFTQEHALHFATRRLWAWRADFGSDAGWAAELGRAAIALRAAGFWPAITDKHFNATVQVQPRETP